MTSVEFTMREEATFLKRRRACAECSNNRSGTGLLADQHGNDEQRSVVGMVNFHGPGYEIHMPRDHRLIG